MTLGEIREIELEALIQFHLYGLLGLHNGLNNQWVASTVIFNLMNYLQI